MRPQMKENPGAEANTHKTSIRSGSKLQNSLLRSAPPHLGRAGNPRRGQPGLRSDLSAAGPPPLRAVRGCAGAVADPCRAVSKPCRSSAAAAAESGAGMERGAPPPPCHWLPLLTSPPARPAPQCLEFETRRDRERDRGRNGDGAAQSGAAPGTAPRGLGGTLQPLPPFPARRRGEGTRLSERGRACPRPGKECAGWGTGTGAPRLRAATAAGQAPPPFVARIRSLRVPPGGGCSAGNTRATLGTPGLPFPAHRSRDTRAASCTALRGHLAAAPHCTPAPSFFHPGTPLESLVDFER